MRERNNMLCIILMMGMSLLLGANIVMAEEDETCNSVSLNELRTAASNIKVSYVPERITEEIEEDPESGATEIDYLVLDVKVYNLSSKLFVRAESSSEYGEASYLLNVRNVRADGSVTIRQKAYDVPITYTFTVLSDAYGCTGKTLRTIKLTLPQFNRYSALEICQDIPDYYLCQQFTTYKVDGRTFYDKVDEYKAKLLAQQEEGDDFDDNNSTANKVISQISKYKYVVVGIIVAIGVVVTVLILRKKKNK